MGTIEVVLGDITQQRVDVIVTAANESLLGGGGVDGAIHRAAGPRLAEAGSRLAPCEPGKAVATPAFDLAPVKHVIHTVGPVWEDGEQGEDEVLTSCYLSSLLLAEELEAESIAFPAIATGVYGFPTERAAEIAALTIRSLAIIDTIRFVAFDQETFEALTRHVARPVEESCPDCGAEAVPIMFGRPAEQARQAADAGLLVLGGCLVQGDGTDPQWECANGHRWTNGERDERRHQVAVLDAFTVTLGEDHGRSVP
ncbi:macro domain-containing protein [Lentzea sp. BCCO 10_0061]|uniref:Macro domain-containing protein n=1 Tax=Lentzea sokolovensis TaxID=3095429 RepID=A0ABU4UZ33_9PSEU|nr:macro domain-containing protein [Lentzea sp. BCCO 10_0061]MDX8144495.1 macro domain-containing protein [Lentzea sp. BCCO 10_0061]